MRRFFAGLLCGLSLVPFGASSAAQQDDIWSGLYRLEWLGGARSVEDVRIERAPDADPATLVEKYQDDLTRWAMSQDAAPRERTTLRRFLPSEYKGWGWDDLPKDVRIECLDASRMFVCRTAPGTTISFGPDRPNRETLLAKTGVFGVVLHAGAFELKKLD
ncbi:MAG: hypothetical protein Q7T73_00010 [Beijerinckiaceae bacterium]|nr:hypothetical protein [Beijerinckiaceae bacterium]